MRISKLGKLFGLTSRKVESSSVHPRTILDEEETLKLLQRGLTESNWPGLYYSTIDELIEGISANCILEIGVANGWHADHLLNKFPYLSYVGVDPWKASYDPNDDYTRLVWGAIGGESEQQALDLLQKVVCGDLNAKYDKRVTIHRETSENFFDRNRKNISTGSPFSQFDICFIDGDHRKDSVLIDLRGCWELTRKGGLICGDDFLWSGVREAVEIFCAEKSVKPYFASNEAQGYPIYVIRKT